ncbi:hypothetical protein ACFVAQ_37745 [Streptomyces sp. NPDC057651]
MRKFAWPPTFLPTPDLKEEPPMDESVRKAFRNDGAVLLKDCLDAAQLTR